MAEWGDYAAGYPGNTARTNTQMQDYMDAHLLLTKKLAGAPKGSNITLAGAGVVSGITSNVHGILNAAGAASDSLVTISTTGVEEGHVLTIYHASSTGTTTVTHGAFLQLEGNVNFDLTGSAAGTPSLLTLVLFNTVWIEAGRTWGNDMPGFAAHIGAVSADNTALTGLTTAVDIAVTEADASNDAIKVVRNGDPGDYSTLGFSRLEVTGQDLALKSTTGVVKAYDQGASAYRQVTTIEDQGSAGGTFDADTVDTKHASDLMATPKYARVSYEVAAPSAAWTVFSAFTNTPNWTNTYDPHGLITGASAPNIKIANSGIYRIVAYGHAFTSGQDIYLMMAVYNTGVAGYGLQGCPVSAAGSIVGSVEIESTVSGEITMTAGNDLILRGYLWRSAAIAATFTDWKNIGLPQVAFSLELWWLNETI